MNTANYIYVKYIGNKHAQLTTNKIYRCDLDRCFLSLNDYLIFDLLNTGDALPKLSYCPSIEVRNDKGRLQEYLMDYFTYVARRKGEELYDDQIREANMNDNPLSALTELEKLKQDLDDARKRHLETEKEIETLEKVIKDAEYPFVLGNSLTLDLVSKIAQRADALCGSILTDGGQPLLGYSTFQLRRGVGTSFHGKGFFLNDAEIDWKIEKDEDNCSVLVPYKKKK